MVGANPIFILTRYWLTKESKHFVYHFKINQAEPAQKLLDKMDNFYEKIVSFLKVDYQDKIDYFRCDSAGEVGMLFNMEKSLARCDMINGVVAGMQDFVPHKVVHIISYRIMPPEEKKLPEGYLDEGLAYYLGGATFFSADLLLSWAKTKILKDPQVSLDSLVLRPEKYHGNEWAALMSSWIKFLIEKYGLDKFKELYSQGRRIYDRVETLEDIYGETMGQLEKDWKNSVLSLSLPEMEVGVSLKGKEIFHMSDPVGDDKGNGHYTYPANEKAIPGMFDLIDFRMGKDDGFVHFQLEFSNLSHTAIDSDQGFNGTFAAIVIDTDNIEKSGNTRLFLDDGNFLLSEKDAYEFVIEVSNAGILVYDQDWIWQLLFLKALSKESHIQGNKLIFAIPQKIIGSPNLNWKLQVATGGEWGGYKNTAYGVGNFMKVGKTAKKDEGGGGSASLTTSGTDTYSNPNVYDILTPKGENQTQILSDYDSVKKKKVIIPMVSLEEGSKSE